DIEVSKLSKDELGTVQTQSHPQYHFSKDGRYFYMFLTEEGSLVKVDLSAKKVVQRLEIGGKLAMGSFVHGQHGPGPGRGSGQHSPGQSGIDQKNPGQRGPGHGRGQHDSGQHGRGPGPGPGSGRGPGRGPGRFRRG
ncbi:MAG: hypothetical protein LGB07_02645, partial [Sulfurovum sp.]|nr:hypothetical protein [Sulfurovum sp.]